MDRLEKEIIDILMESRFYFDLSLWERYKLMVHIRRYLDFQQSPASGPNGPTEASGGTFPPP
jgi:hypothetical protein